MAFWSSAAVKAYIDENNKGIQTYCLVVLATFAIGSLLLVLASVLLPLLFALFLSLHFSPLIELLECKRGPRCLRECNMPCRRATKNAVKLCKGPDNEFKNNMYNGFVEGVVDLFCGLKFPAWLAILTTFGVIIGFFFIIGVIVSDSINGLLKDRDKWVTQWENLNNQVAELAAQQGFTVTSEDINKGATEFLLNNVVTPLTSLLPSVITYTFLTLAFLVFVLVSPSTFFGDADALTTTDPDELSCSDDEVPDDELAAAVDNVITAQAAAILVEEEDDEDDGILGESRKSRKSQLAALRRPMSAAHWDGSRAIAGSARQLLTHGMQRRRTTAHFATPGGGSVRGPGRRHNGLAATTTFAGRHGSIQPPVSPGTVGQWKVDVQTGWKPRPRTAEPSPVADGKRAPGQRMRREELSHEEGPDGAATEGHAPSSGGRSAPTGTGAEPDSKARPRAGSNLMHRATKVLEVVGLNIAEGSSTENEEDTEDEIPLEADQDKHGTMFAMSPYPAAQVGSPGGPEMDSDMMALEENRRRLRAWARRQRRAGRYLDNAEATAVMLHQKAQRRVTRYIVVHSWLSAATGLSVGLSLLAIGAPLPALFGLMAFVLNFIPSVGSWIATILPIPFILFDPDSDFTTLILAIMLPGFMQVLLGNFVEPALLGKLCKVDPIVILVSILLFGYVWGIAGMVLAVPMVVIIKLVFKQMAHPIPRYIAGIIVGNLYRYRARLDRDVRRRIRYQRLLRAAENARESAEHAAMSPASDEAADKGLGVDPAQKSGASLQMRGDEDHSDSCGPGGAVLGPRLRHPAGEESRRVRWTQGRTSARQWADGEGARASHLRVSRSARVAGNPMASTAPAQPRRRSHEPIGQEEV